MASLEFVDGVFKDPTDASNLSEGTRVRNLADEALALGVAKDIYLQPVGPPDEATPSTVPTDIFPNVQNASDDTQIIQGIPRDIGTSALATIDEYSLPEWAGNSGVTGSLNEPGWNGLSGRKDSSVYHSYAGTDIVASIVLPNSEHLTLGELQTVSYSMHRENTPVRILGHVSPIAFIKGPRTIAGSLIFTVFNYYAFYRLKQFQASIRKGVYPVADMLPPFDIIITFSNELGTLSKMRIYGVTIVDEGGTMSVDDLITEQTFSYMARGIMPMTGFKPRNEYFEGVSD